MKSVLFFFIRYDIPLLVGLGTVFYLSSLPGETFDPFWFSHADKFAHLAIYTCVGFLFGRLLSASPLFKNRFSLVIPLTILLTGLYGLTDEWHQTFVAGRSAEGLDLLADIVGGFAGSLLIIPYRSFTSGILAARPKAR